MAITHVKGLASFANSDGWHRRLLYYYCGEMLVRRSKVGLKVSVSTHPRESSDLFLLALLGIIILTYDTRDNDTHLGTACTGTY